MPIRAGLPRDAVLQACMCVVCVCVCVCVWCGCISAVYRLHREACVCMSVYRYIQRERRERAKRERSERERRESEVRESEERAKRETPSGDCSRRRATSPCSGRHPSRISESLIRASYPSLYPSLYLSLCRRRGDGMKSRHAAGAVRVACPSHLS